MQLQVVQRCTEPRRTPQLEAFPRDSAWSDPSLLQPKPLVIKVQKPHIMERFQKIFKVPVRRVRWPAECSANLVSQVPARSLS